MRFFSLMKRIGRRHSSAGKVMGPAGDEKFVEVSVIDLWSGYQIFPFHLHMHPAAAAVHLVQTGTGLPQAISRLEAVNVVRELGFLLD